MFSSFVEKRLKAGDAIDFRILANVVVSPKPREHLMALYIGDLISGSLQSTDALLKAGAAFDVKSSAITTEPKALGEVFRV